MNKKQQLIYNEIISKYNFKENQKEQIELGLEKDLDVSIYTKPEYNYEQMSEIRLGLEKGLNVSIYSKPEFN